MLFGVGVTTSCWVFSCWLFGSWFSFGSSCWCWMLIFIGLGVNWGLAMGWLIFMILIRSGFMVLIGCWFVIFISCGFVILISWLGCRCGLFLFALVVLYNFWGLFFTVLLFLLFLLAFMLGFFLFFSLFLLCCLGLDFASYNLLIPSSRRSTCYACCPCGSWSFLINSGCNCWFLGVWLSGVGSFVGTRCRWLCGWLFFLIGWCAFHFAVAFWMLGVIFVMFVVFGLFFLFDFGSILLIAYFLIALRCLGARWNFLYAGGVRVCDVR